MSYAIGIDLGTTNSVVSVFRRGVAETLETEGRASTPSVVSFREDGGILVGLQAKSRVLLAPESTVSSVKRFMGAYWIIDGVFTIASAIRGRSAYPSWGLGIFVGIVGVLAEEDDSVG